MKKRIVKKIEIFEKLTKEDFEILRNLARFGPANVYELSEKRKIVSDGKAASGLKKLETLGLVKSGEVGPRGSTPYYLTFKGLCYLLHLGYIQPDEGLTAWEENKISFPRSEIKLESLSDQQREEVFKVLDKLEGFVLKAMPTEFFKALSRLNPKEIEEMDVGSLNVIVWSTLVDTLKRENLKEVFAERKDKVKEALKDLLVLNTFNGVTKATDILTKTLKTYVKSLSKAVKKL